MPRVDHVESRPEFWRCRTCGTPNPWASYSTLCLGCGAPRPPATPAPSRRPSIGRRVAAVREIAARIWTIPRRARSRRTLPPSRLGRWVARASWAYAAVVLFLIFLINGLGDRWWAATLLLFGPRWPALLPLVVLVPLVAWKSRKSLPVLAATAALIVFPLMGACVSWRGLTAPAGRDLGIRVLTCNVGDKLLNVVALAELVEREHPDIVALQECRDLDPRLVFPGAGWSIIQTDAQLLLASRLPIRSNRLYEPTELGGNARLLACEIEAPGGSVAVHVVHLETPRSGLESVLHGGLSGVPELRANIKLRDALSWSCARVVAVSGPRSLVLGDFNLPAESAIFRRYWSSLEDAFAASGLGFGHTKRTRWFGARIDHILCGASWHARSCRVGPDVGSDHLPVLADLEPLPEK